MATTFLNRFLTRGRAKAAASVAVGHARNYFVRSLDATLTLESFATAAETVGERDAILQLLARQLGTSPAGVLMLWAEKRADATSPRQGDMSPEVGDDRSGGE